MIWFQLNGYKVWDSFNKYQILTTVFLGVPVSIGMFFAWKLAYESFDSLWSARLVSFGVSFLVFPVLTHFFFGESMFRPKIMVCIALSMIIILIQLFWPEEASEQNIRKNEGTGIEDGYSSETKDSGYRKNGRKGVSHPDF